MYQYEWGGKRPPYRIFVNHTLIGYRFRYSAVGGYKEYSEFNENRENSTSLRSLFFPKI